MYGLHMAWLSLDSTGFLDRCRYLLNHVILNHWCCSWSSTESRPLTVIITKVKLNWWWNCLQQLTLIWRHIKDGNEICIIWQLSEPWTPWTLIPSRDAPSVSCGLNETLPCESLAWVMSSSRTWIRTLTTKPCTTHSLLLAISCPVR